MNGGTMPKAEGKTFDFKSIDSINPELLETIPFINKHLTTETVITTVTEEFSAVCPFSGLPDVAKLIIKYIPDKKIVELKSLKYYVTTFRDVGVYQEQATHIIYNHLKQILQTEKLIVTTIYKARGGFITTTEVGRLA